MSKCPLCSTHVAVQGSLCESCARKAVAADPAHRRRQLAGAAQTLMIWFAVLLFIKGCWMALAEPSYASFIASMGLPQKSAGVHYLAAAFFGLSAAAYVLAWIGTLLRRSWRVGVCGGALAIFAVGQIVTQFVGAMPEDPWAKAVALTVIWMVVPVFQFAALLLSGESSPVVRRGVALGSE